MKTNKILSCILLCMGVLYAQGQTVYTLDQCKKIALENNIRIRNARNNVQGAEQTKKEAFTNYFPSVKANGMWFDANQGLIGMALAPEMQLSLLKDGVIAGITAVQPVFAGGQIINGNRLANIGVEVSRLQLEQSEREVCLTTEQYFWQIVTLQEKLKTLTSINAMLERLQKDVTVAVEAGITNRNDLLQVGLRKNEVTSTVMNLKNSLSLCKSVLAQYIGVTDSIMITCDIDINQIPPFHSDLFREPASSLLLTPEHHLLEKNLEANRLQYKLAVGKNLPSVGIGIGYLYHDLMGNSRSSGMVFASVSIPISGWWGGSHSIKRQQIQVRNAKNELRDKSELLVIRMQQTWNDLQNAYDQLGIAGNSIEQAQENLRLNNDYYKAGTSSMSDLLNAQSLYQQSRDKYVEAYCIYQIKQLEYLQATGRN